jgi:hypothetical protein
LSYCVQDRLLNERSADPFTLPRGLPELVKHLGQGSIGRRWGQAFLLIRSAPLNGIFLSKLIYFAVTQAPDREAMHKAFLAKLR